MTAFAVEPIQVVAWVFVAVGFLLAARLIGAVLSDPPKRCSLCGSKDTRPVVYQLATTEWTCDACGFRWKEP